MLRLGVVSAVLARVWAADWPSHCDTAVVGGGWAGVYYAFRVASSSSEQVCLFEATERIGGRTYSHTFAPNGENFTLDVGAYRFTPDMHLPGDVIMKVLELKTACYEPSCTPAGKDFPPPFIFNYTAPLRRIVDSDGMPAGYMTAVEGLVKNIQAHGGKVFMDARVTDVVPSSTGAKLVFGSREVTANKVLLNLPRGAILGLPSLKEATPARTTKMQECVKFDLPADLFPPGHSLNLGGSLTKAYAFYEDAWWHTKLNKTDGQYPDNAFLPVNTSEGIPVGIHFNDGPVRCDSPGVNCRGFLQVFYSPATESFFQDLRKDADHPMSQIDAKDGSASAAKLQTLHDAVMEATKDLFVQKGVDEPKVPPTMLVVGVWGRDGQGFTAPTKVYYSESKSVPGGPDPLEKACGVPSLTEAEYRSSVLMPTGTPKLLVANNDWVAQKTEKLFGDWAEESLLQAERGLHLLGVERPEWLDEAYYNEKVEQVVAADSSVTELVV